MLSKYRQSWQFVAKKRKKYLPSDISECFHFILEKNASKNEFNKRK